MRDFRTELPRWLPSPRTLDQSNEAVPTEGRLMLTLSPSSNLQFPKMMHGGRCASNYILGKD